MLNVCVLATLFSPRLICTMQDVCSTLDSQMGAQIKSESPLNTLHVTAAVQQHQIAPPPSGQAQQQQMQSSPMSQSMAGAEKLVGPTIIDKRADTAYWMQTESGFINSQPSMAEFLTHLGPESPKLGPQGYPMGGSGSVDGMDGVPEYPWMKEKKTARKNNAQG